MMRLLLFYIYLFVSCTDPCIYTFMHTTLCYMNSNLTSMPNFSSVGGELKQLTPTDRCCSQLENPTKTIASWLFWKVTLRRNGSAARQHHSGF